MQFIADLHIHSRFSMATSRDCNPENLHRWARLKGLTLVGTGDFTHPGWFGELREKLEPAEEGLFRLMPTLAAKADIEVPAACRGAVRFMLSVEISSIYKKRGKTRRVHTLIYARDFKTAEGISNALAKIGKLASDGRPILKLDCEELLKIVVDFGESAFIVPAHIWTPHFSVLGAFSDFNDNGVPDVCDEDCNSNGILDEIDISLGDSLDDDFNGVPDTLGKSAPINGHPGRTAMPLSRPSGGSSSGA